MVNYVKMWECLKDGNTYEVRLNKNGKIEDTCRLNRDIPKYKIPVVPEPRFVAERDVNYKSLVLNLYAENAEIFE
jgi:hypothetical protein